ncbi:MAG TPA: magnesium transporter [Nevskia sp.]|nr:magnesium transporter [Nevskia sp.]
MATAQDLAAPRQEDVRELALALRKRAPSDGFLLLQDKPDPLVAAALGELDPQMRRALLERYPETQRAALRAIDTRLHAQADAAQQPHFHHEDSVGALMLPAQAVFPLGCNVRQIVERVRELAQTQVLVIYAYVVDAQDRLQGLVTMRDLLLAAPQERVEDIMLGQPFALQPQMTVENAMRETARRHYPLYPVCDEAGVLLGTVAGAVLFEARAYEISAQSGLMVGVDSEERLLSPWTRSLRLRHPWLQVNLLTGLVVGFIVSLFSTTLSQLVILTAFLPILSSVAGNTGCQTLAVTLRGIALDEYKNDSAGPLLRKELLLGALNGAVIGLVAGVVMYFYALSAHAAHPLRAGLVVMIAMTGACLTGGLAGVAVPSLLRRFGADPATASSIFLTTTTDIVGISLFLGMASVILL